MRWLLFAAISLLLFMASAKPGQADDPKPTNKGAAFFANMSAENFIKRFDKNKDGVLTRDELPPRLAENFDKLDTNGDGKLDKQEVETFLNRFRQRMANNKNGAPQGDNASPQRTVEMILKRFDTNHDGRISKDEARGPLAKNFDRIDVNKDGYLDRQELLRIAPLFQKAMSNAQGPAKGKPGASSPGARPAVRPVLPDFDALDNNADGRLSRDELKGTPLADDFDKIDTNKDGKIDRKEFEAYFQKEAEKQAAAADKK
jgi:Ca2+-binding EF-hand superfamily protein